MSNRERILQHLEEGIDVRKRVHALTQEIEMSAKKMSQVLKHNGQLYFCGNGGSAADAQHIAAELVGRFQKKRPGLPAIAFTTNTSTLTAIGNDFAYDQIFVRQVEAFCLSRDLLVGISTSGKSPNVLKALRLAKKQGTLTVGLTGAKPNPIARAADLALAIPSHNTQYIQEMHITIGHIWCLLIENFLFSDEHHTKK